MINTEERVNFYLGEELSKIKKYDKKKIDSLTNIEKLKKNNNFKNYVNDLEKILKRTNNLDKEFKCLFGDIERDTHILDLVKNRNCNYKNSVILNLNSGRHWNYYYNRPEDIEFEKKKNLIFWRGITTGQKNKIANRFDLIERWFDKNKNIDVGFSGICQGKNDYKKYVKGKCNLQEFLKYKYILSVQGNDKDSGLNWKLNSNSLVLMAKPTVTSWLMESMLKPNVHYVLLKDDFSDLEEKFNWCEKNQDKCKEIIKNANKFMENFKDKKRESGIEDILINRYFSIIS